MKIIGITGTSGSGKTTLTYALAKKCNASVINADKVAKELSTPGTEYLKAIESKLGKAFFYKDGSLNRNLLAKTIYENQKALEMLNAITFHYIVTEILHRIQQLKKISTNIVLIDAPLLFESKLNEHCDCVIAVIADENIKIARICQRDGIDIQMAKNRLAIQSTNEFYQSHANIVVTNNHENMETLLNDVYHKLKTYL